MKVKRQWKEVPEVFEAVLEALDEHLDADAVDGTMVLNASVDEKSSYGEDGYIVIRTEDGRRFYIEISEQL